MPAAPQPQDVRDWKAQYEGIRKELEGLRSQLQNLVKKEKDRELVTKAWSMRCNELVEGEVAARRAVIAVRKETDKMGSELDRVIEERDREKAINVDLKKKLKLAQEGLQVEEWEERLRVAETRSKDAETNEEEVISGKKKLEIRVAAAKASSKEALRQARSAQCRFGNTRKKQRAAEEAAIAAERECEVSLKALTKACAQITTLKEQLDTVATMKLERELNKALTASNEEIADLGKLLEAHNVVLALTGKDQEIVALKRIMRAQGEGLTAFYRRA